MRELFGKLADKGKLAVALSGGGDSMALVLMAHEAGLDIVALTVDHGLRPESAAEAAWVAEEMNKRDIPHEILAYKGKIPKTGIEEVARGYRYKLLTTYCKKHGISTLLVGHNADEQAETFLLNLVRGSGIRGLSAMRERMLRDGIEIIRPLLSVPKKELQRYLKTRRQKWVEDPSNDDLAYTRVKIRKLSGTLENLGLSRDRILETAKNLQSADDALSYYTEKAVQNLVLSKSEKRILLSLRELETLPRATQLASLAAIISPGKPIRAESLVRALESMLAGRASTLGPFKIFPENPKRIVLAKLPAKC